MAQVKKAVLDLVKKLPPDCTLEDVQYQLYVRQMIEAMAHEGPFRSMAPRLCGRVAGTALRSAARTSESHTTAPTRGHDPRRLPGRGPVVGARAGGWADCSVDNSFLGS